MAIVRVDGTTRIPPSGTESPMTRSRLIIAAAAVIVAIAVGGFVVYDQVLRGDSAAALALPTASTAPRADGKRRRAVHPVRRPPAPGRLGRRAGDVAGHMDRRGRQRRGLPRPRAARQPAGRERRGRPHRPGHRARSRSRRAGTTTTLTAASLTRRHDHASPRTRSMRDNRLRTRGPPDRRVPDRDLHADRAGRDAGGRPGRDRRRTSR